MKHYNLQIPENTGGIVNLTAPFGTEFPSFENAGELFFRTDIKTLYVHTGTEWISTIGDRRRVTRHIATQGQTTFNVLYDVGHIDVFLNGVRLVENGSPVAYTATNGTSITLTDAPEAGESVIIISYKAIDSESNEFLASDGSASSPSYSFLNDTNTGLYRIGNDQLGITSGGTLRLTVNTSGIVVAGTTTFNSVAYTWPGSAGSSGQVLTTNGSGVLSWSTISAADGAGSPIPLYPGDNISELVNDAGYLTSHPDPHLLSNGSASAPTYSFSNAPDFGMYYTSDLNFSVHGKEALHIQRDLITGHTGIQINAGLTSNTHSYIDFSSSTDSTQEDYSARIIRNSGKTGNLLIRNKGGGYTVIFEQEDDDKNVSSHLQINSIGSVGIPTASSSINLQVNKNIAGSGGIACGIFSSGTIQSDVTTSGRYFQSSASTQATSFTAAEILHFFASQGTFGTGSTVTSQSGFIASATLTGATNNYGFYGNIPSGTGRWNFYANSAADNYFAGKVLIGNTTPPERGIFQVVNAQPWISSTNTVTDNAGKVGGITTMHYTNAEEPFGALCFASEEANNTVFIGGGNSNINAATIIRFITASNNTTVSGPERARFDSNGQLLVGGTVAQTSRIGGNNFTAKIQNLGAGEGPSSILSMRFSNDNNGPNLYLSKSRGALINTNTIVQNNDNLGLIRFFGADGTNYIQGAYVAAFVDGTPGTDSMPSRLVFATSPSGSASPTERMRIANTGVITTQTSNYETLVTSDNVIPNKKYVDQTIEQEISSSVPVGALGQTFFIDQDGTRNTEADYIVKTGQFIETDEELEEAKLRIPNQEEIFNNWYRFSHATSATVSLTRSSGISSARFGSDNLATMSASFPVGSVVTITSVIDTSFNGTWTVTETSSSGNHHIIRWEQLSESDVSPGVSGSVILNFVYPALPGEVNAWVYDTNTQQIICTVNSDSYIGFVSDKRYVKYTHEVRLSSSNTDDDTIGVLIAWYKDPSTGYEYTLSATRSTGGLTPWSIVYNILQQGSLTIADGTSFVKWGNGNYGANAGAAGYVTNQPLGGWDDFHPTGTLVKIVRDGDIITCSTTDLGEETYIPAADLVIDLTSDSVLEKFRGPREIGFTSRSQSSSTYTVLQFTDTSNAIFDVRDGTMYLYDETGSPNEWIAQTGSPVVNLWTEIGVGRLLHDPYTTKLYFVVSKSSVLKVNDQHPDPHLLQDGTASNPTYSFINDVDTGIYRANTDELGFTTGGTRSLSVSSTNLYFGPDIDNAFHIHRSSDTEYGIRPTVASGQILLDINPIASDGISISSVRLFRATNTTGNTFFQIHLGNNSTTSNHILYANNSQNSLLCSNNGNLVVGNASGTFTSSAGTNTLTNGIRVGNGSAASPALTFSSDTDTGIHRGGTDILNLGTNGTTRLSINAEGNIGIPSPVSNLSLNVNKVITGSTNAYGIVSSGTVQSNVTGTAANFNSNFNTAAQSFTLSTFYHYVASQNEIGAGSTVTNQHGFHAGNSLTGATSNYGFFSNLASGTGRWNFYAGGTADNYFAGKVRLTNPVSVTTLDSLSTLVAAATDNSGHNISLVRYNIDAIGPSLFLAKSKVSSVGTDTIVANNDTLGNIDFRGNNNSAFELAARINGQVDGTPSGSSMPGRLVFWTTPSGSNNVVERMRIDSFGRIIIGGGTLNNSAVAIRTDMSGFGQTTNHGIRSNIKASIEATTTINGFYSDIRGGDAASSYTTTDVSGFHAANATTGTNQTITNQYGFVASGLTDATNNYGFFSNLASGTGRWNFYANGTADNYFAGNVLTGSNALVSTIRIGSVTGLSARTQVAGTSHSTSSSTNIRFSTDASGPALRLAKSRGTLNTNTIVQNNDGLGSLHFLGANGTEYVSAAFIDVQVDETPSSSSMPGKLRFGTTPSGSNAPNERMVINSAGIITTSNKFGYGLSGSGGTVTQTISKSSGVTIDTPNGQITTHNASLGANTRVSFTVTNSSVEANDVIVIHRKSGGTAGSYQVNIDSVAAGSFVVVLWNYSGGALSEAVVLQYAVIKGSTS